MKSFYSKICLYSLLIGGTISCQTEIPDPPEASYTFEVNNIPGASEVTFTNNSSNATEYAWDFGDGGTSNEESPTHTYNSGDRYAVKLIARGDGGSDGVTQDVRVVTSLPAPVADFTIANNNCEAPCTVSFANTSSNASTYTWDFNDGGTATTKDASHRYENAGTYGVKLIASNAVGTSNTKIKEVTIKPKSVLILDFNDPKDVNEWTRKDNNDAGNTSGSLNVSGGYLNVKTTGNLNNVKYELRHSRDLSGITQFEIVTKFGKEELGYGNPRICNIQVPIKEYGGSVFLNIKYDNGFRKLTVGKNGSETERIISTNTCKEITFTIRSLNGKFEVIDDCTNEVWFSVPAVTLAGPIGLFVYYDCSSGKCAANSYGSFAVDYIYVRKY